MDPKEIEKYRNLARSCEIKKSVDKMKQLNNLKQQAMLRSVEKTARFAETLQAAARGYMARQWLNTSLLVRGLFFALKIIDYFRPAASKSEVCASYVDS